MNIHVQYMAQLRTAIGRTGDEVEVPERISVRALLVHLAERTAGDSALHLVTPDAEPQRGLLVVVNDQAIPPASMTGTLLKPGDVVTLMPPIAGG